MASADAAKARGSRATARAQPLASSLLSSFSSSFFGSGPLPLFAAALTLRVVLLLYGLWQDANSPLKYTDIDYLVFIDAARFTARGGSPYDRETYRYTPLLAWLLLPTSAESSPVSPAWDAAWRCFGKLVFAAADLLAGALIVRVLTMRLPRAGGRAAAEGAPMDAGRARRYAALWLLNPMVATISTRGSSEGLLGVLVMALLWAVLSRRTALAGLLLGLSVHFKIYPFIYAPAVVWWMDRERLGNQPTALVASSWGGGKVKEARLRERLSKAAMGFVNPDRVKLVTASLATFVALNLLMYKIYGVPFLTHTYLHHVTRIDHRHNFSPYNILLYLTSAFPTTSGLRIESVAFLPQLLLSTVLIPLVMAKRHLPTTMLAQTLAFVTFNKVCTSQYFLWYMVFLPLYLPRSSLIRNKRRGLAALLLWILSQGLWLHQGFQLEFLGKSTFVPALWLSSLAFFLVNCWILGVSIGDVVLQEA